MKTLKQLREEYDSELLSSVDFLPEEIMLEANKKTSLVSSTPSFKQMPALLLFRRMTYRKYPGDQTVALYYSALVDKYLSIPFGPTGNLNLSEAVILDEEGDVAHFVPKPPKRKVKVAGGNKEEIDQQHKKLMTYHKARRKNMKEEQIDELHQDTIWDYSDKAITSLDKSRKVGYEKDFSPKPGKKAAKARKTFDKRDRGLAMASKRLGGAFDESAAWQRKAGKNPEGGLNRKGIASYRRENPGSKLSMAVTTEPSKLDPDSKPANRRKSFCARMGGMKKRLTSAKTARDPDSRINKALRKWNCEESFQNKLASIREERIDEFAPLAAGGAALRAVGGSTVKNVLKTVGKTALSAAGKAIFGDDDGEKARKAEATPSKGTLSTSLRGAKVKSRTPDLSIAGDPVAARQSEKLQQRYTEKSLKQMKENKMSDIRKMVKENVDYKDLYINGRNVTLNKNMAKRILEVYDSVNSTNKKLVENMLNEDMESFKKLLNFSIKA